MNETYHGGNKLILGIVLGVITFWLFAQSLVNVVPNLQQSFGADMGTISIAVSLTALFSGMFVVGAGGIADKIGRVKMTNIGLILSIIGSALIIISNLPSLLILGRVIQGFSAACIMPSTLAIMKTYYQGAERQRALSFWSIGSWGGSGICSLFGGAVATTMGWRWIFIFSIIIAILSMILIKGTPETKSEVTNVQKFDVKGLTVLVIMLLSLNVLITKGGAIGYTSLWFYVLVAIVLVSFFVFLNVEKKVDNPLIDFKLFKNKPYTGATISNFLLNCVAGTLIVANTFVQQGLGYTSLQAGYLSITYLIAVLAMIRVGEKLLQKMGSKRPMLLGSMIVVIGILLISLVFLPETLYIISCVIGYLCFGLGLGLYATPSTDTAVSNAPLDKVGVASGIYKMASSLGGAFGVAISGAVFAGVVAATNLHTGAMIALWVNVLMGVLALIAIIYAIPNDDKRVKTK
ncbi:MULTISPECIES: MFS transporter [Staphylococcus]|uniref:MFS transporter n=1 Tax=Staphylococcus TaxID=1279 RepID=UPI0002F5EF78|nr:MULTISPECIES: MFS transporter [Staphylococcus]MBM6506173.1 MFS transporter [Staphylococcus pasteuri]PTU82401.1 MFS transporter [Staphylococcus pasteuri]PTU83901.1 MFS transporter [Staphylococcus pasteuri]QQT10358.1 MFS transporter [Staphylococcus pasteuri]QQT19758.1 MFS transporter [Staphylococcus pasteuri]